MCGGAPLCCCVKDGARLPRESGEKELQKIHDLEKRWVALDDKIRKQMRLPQCYDAQVPLPHPPPHGAARTVEGCRLHDTRHECIPQHRVKDVACALGRAK